MTNDNNYQKNSEENLIDCPLCGEKIRADALKCRYCKEFITQPTEQKDSTNPVIVIPQQSKTVNLLTTPISSKPLLIALLIILISGLGFLLFFHVISYEGGFTLIPKEHATFSECFVSLDDILSQYNNRSLGERIRGEGVNMYLVRKLEEKGLIKDTPQSSSNSTNNTDAASENESSAQPPVEDISFLLKFQGKYPRDINFFEIPLIKTRLEALLSSNYQSFLDRLDVQSAIQTSTNEVFVSGCKPHMCNTDNASFSIDLGRNTIFLGFTVDGNKRVLSENDDSNYPELFKNWYNSD